jgi:hypothetical protein
VILCKVGQIGREPCPSGKKCRFIHIRPEHHPTQHTTGLLVPDVFCTRERFDQVFIVFDTLLAVKMIGQVLVGTIGRVEK